MNGLNAVFVFHLNKDHSEVDWKILKEFLCNGDFLKMLREIRVKVVFSVQAEDVKFWQEVNPKIIEEIKSNPCIEILLGTYTHTMPNFFPDDLAEQLSAGNEVLKKVFGPQLSWVGCLPEADANTQLAPYLEEAGWKGLLALKDAHYTYEQDKPFRVRAPLINEPILRLGQMSLIMAKGGDLRNIYLKFYRGFATPAEFLQALKSKIIDSGVNFSVFLTDFEVPLVNARLDLWTEFFQALQTSSIKFRHFKDLEIKRLIQRETAKAPSAKIERYVLPKWHHSPGFYKIIQETKTDFYLRARLTISDTFSARYFEEVLKKTQVELPIKDSDKKVVIKPDLRRIEAFNYFLVKAREKPLPVINDPVLKWYLGVLEKIHSKSC